MFAILIIVTYIILIMFIKGVSKTPTHWKALSIYLTFTFLIILISIFNPYGLYDVNNYIYILWILNIILTIVFSIIFSSKRDFGELDFEEKISKLMNSKYLFIINLFVLFGIIYFLNRYNSLAASSSIKDLRIIRYSSLFRNGYEVTIFNYILTPLLRIIMIISAIALANKKFKNINFVLSIISIFSYMMIGYGRSTIIEFLFYIIITYILINKKIKKSFVIKALTYAAISLFVIASLTAIRIVGINNLNLNSFKEYGITNVSRQFVVYLTGGFRTLNIFVKSTNLENYYLGRMTFAGVEDLLSLITGFFKISFSPINDTLGVYTQNSVYIGNGITFNAFYTALFNCYGDLGILGVIVFAFMNGLILTLFINNMYKKRTLYSIMIFIYFQSILMSTIYRWNLQFGSYLMVLVILIFLDIKETKKGKKYENN